MKKALSLLISALLLLFGAAGSVQAHIDAPVALQNEGVPLGDLNDSGVPDTGDVTLILRQILFPDEEWSRGEETWQRADVNLDGKINLEDAINTLRYIVKAEDQFVPVANARVYKEWAFAYALSFAAVNVNSIEIMAGEMDFSGYDFFGFDDADVDIMVNPGNVDVLTGLNTGNVTGAVLNITGQSGSTAGSMRIMSGNSVYLNNVQVNKMVVDEEDVHIDLDGDSNINEAVFKSNATVTGGDLIVEKSIDPGCEVIFQYRLRLDANPAGGGIVTVENGKIAYLQGDEINIKAGALPGYSFTHWVEEEPATGALGDPESAETTYTMPDNTATLTAHFELISHFLVDPNQNRIWGFGWEPDAEVTFNINDDEHEGTAETRPNGQFSRIAMAGEFDIKPGDTIIVADNTGNEAEYTVRDLHITGVDYDANEVHGTAEPDSVLTVQILQHPRPQEEVTADGEGNWSVTFAGFNIVESTDISAVQRDEEGNGTQVHWPLMFGPPHFVAGYFDHDEGDERWMIEGFWWPFEEVTVTIRDDHNQLILSDVAVVDPGNHFSLAVTPEEIEPGYVVTVSADGFVTSHTVRNLVITHVDEETGIVTGTAEEGAEVMVDVIPGRPDLHFPVRWVTAGDGTWEVNFSEPAVEEPENPEDEAYDIQPGDVVRAEIADHNMNGTWAFWAVPHEEYVCEPGFDVMPGHNVIMGFCWADVPQINITIDGSEFYQTVANADHGHFLLDLDGTYDIKAGDVVTVDDGETVLSHTVTDLVLESSNIDGTVNGSAAPGTAVTVQRLRPADGYGPPQLIEEIEVVADPGGEWSVKFTAIEAHLGEYALAFQEDAEGLRTSDSDVRYW